MRTRLYISLILLCTGLLTKAQQSTPCISGFEKTMPSLTLGSKRTVWIHIPNSNTGNKNGAAHYPVIYLLEGDANFNSIVGITEFMSKAGICPPMIVVWILHPARMR